MVPRGRVIPWDPHYRRARWRRGVCRFVAWIPRPRLPPFWSGFVLGAAVIGTLAGAVVVGQGSARHVTSSRRLGLVQPAATAPAHH